MKKCYTLLWLLFLGTFLFAKDVDVNYAKQVATNFYLQNNHDVTAVTLQLVDACKMPTNVGSTIDGKPVYYVFDVTGNHGFVIIAGDDLVQPVLGYNTTGSYPVGNINPSTSKWMDNYKKQIIYVKQNIHETTYAITQKWMKYYNNTEVVEHTSRAAQAVNPLCQTQWNQAPNENGMCPYDAAHSEKCVTGCVATAMAQVMKFWNYPTQGVGNHSYNDQHYGTQAANFGNTTYNWAGMPNVLSAPDANVETVMFHCGVSVDMGYGVSGAGGSNAYVVASKSPVQACAEYAYKTYFGYDPASLQGIVRDNYSDANWTSTLKGELDAGRPIEYAGFGNGGGHTWVCDGYDQNDFFHQNWGWGGNSNGFFSLNNLDPASLGAGGGTGGFNGGQQALIGIKPLSGGGGGGGGTINQGSIALFAATTVSANPFVSGGSFTVNADIANNGATAFTGDFAAALFNSDGVFAGFVQEFTNQTAQAGFHYPVSFTVNPLNLIPGTYILGIYYKNGSNNYSLVSPGSYNNPVTVTITTNYSDVQMAGGSTVTPTVIIKGQAVSIVAQIGNAGSSAITGWLSADLYGQNGAYVAAIQQVQGTLAASTSYSITFANANINVAPGTYFVAYTSTTDQTNYNLVYTTDFTNKPNPIKVVVEDSPLSPDVYESDNTEGTAHAFAVNFSGNNASVSTTGSNMHIGNDYDYYSINLPGGTNYSITAQVYDSYHGGGNTYTNDVQFSYNVNGGSFSTTYDDVMGAPIYVPGGGTVVFFVADYYQGSVGTYLLDLQIARGANVGINDIAESKISVYPNPANNFLFVDAGDAKGNYTMKIFNTLGQQVSESIGSFTGSPLKNDVSTLAAGIYTLQLKTEAGIANSKFIVK